MAVADTEVVVVVEVWEVTLRAEVTTLTRAEVRRRTAVVVAAAVARIRVAVTALLTAAVIPTPLDTDLHLTAALTLTPLVEAAGAVEVTVVEVTAVAHPEDSLATLKKQTKKQKFSISFLEMKLTLIDQNL